MKYKFSKKSILYTSLCISTVAISATVLSIKLSNPYKPAFYAFSSYVDNETSKEISKNYSYKEYGSVNEFEYAIENNKAIAGITSDYAIINMIKKEQIAPISKKIAKIAKIENIWEYFTEATINQMDWYNKFIDNQTQNKLQNKYKNEYGENYVFTFKDFVVPYFLNEKIIAYDTKKLFNKTNLEKDPLGINNDLNNLENTLKLIKTKATQNNVKTKFQWTKNEMENVVYGSEYNNEVFSTQITEENYQKLLNNFSNIVKNGTGDLMSNNSVNIFDADSDIILNNLINPASKINIAFLYNGDALDAYYGHDNFNEVDDGDRLRVIRPKNNIRILDAFVVSSSINDQQMINLLEIFNDLVFNNMFKTKNEIEMKGDDVYKEKGIMKIFDFVNYTPAARGAYEYIKDNYFYNEKIGKDDEIAKDIFQIEKRPNYNALPMAPIDKQTLSNLTLNFQKKLNGK